MNNFKVNMLNIQMVSKYTINLFHGLKTFLPVGSLLFNARVRSCRWECFHRDGIEKNGTAKQNIDASSIHKMCIYFAPSLISDEDALSEAAGIT